MAGAHAFQFAEGYVRRYRHPFIPENRGDFTAQLDKHLVYSHIRVENYG